MDDSQTRTDKATRAAGHPPIEQLSRYVPLMVDADMSYHGLGEGRIGVTMPYREDWLGDSERQLIHTSALITALDGACGGSVVNAIQAAKTVATLDLRCDYLRPAVAGKTIHAWARPFRMTEHIAFVRCEAHQGDENHPVATGIAAFMLGTPNRRGRNGSSTSAEQKQTSFSTVPLPAPLLVRIPYTRWLGIDQATTDNNGAIYRLPYVDRLIGNHRLPALHGGIVAGFAENVALLHLTTDQQSRRVPKPIDFSVDFLRSAGPRDCYARCTINRLGARVAQVQIHVWQDTETRPVAVCRTHFLMEQDLV